MLSERDRFLTSSSRRFVVEKIGRGTFEAVRAIGQKHDKMLKESIEAHQNMVEQLKGELEEGLKDLGCEVTLREKGREVGYETEISIFRGSGKELDLLAWYNISPWSKLSVTQHREIILNLVIDKFSKRISDFKE